MMLRYLLLCALVRAVQLICTDANQKIIISVLWDGYRAPEVNWKDNPRWEEIQFEPKWPDSFFRIRRGSQGSEELVLHKRDEMKCYTITSDVVLFTEKKDLSYIFNDTVRHQIANSTVIVGPYFRAVALLAAMNDITYLVTSPMPPATSYSGLTRSDDGTTLPMWPSWNDVSRAVTTYLTAENIRKVLVLYTAQSATAHEVSQMVNNAISKLTTVQYTSITVIRYPNIPKPPAVPGPEQITELDAIYKLINEKRVQTVIAFFDNDDPMWLLQQFFVQGRSLDRDDLSWLMIDQTLSYNSKMTQLDRVRVLKTHIFTLVPSYPPRETCLSFYDNTNKMGAMDGMLLLDRVMQQLDPADFTKIKFFEAMKTNVLMPDAQFSMDARILAGHIYLRSPVKLGWTLAFNTTTQRKRDFEMQIRHLLPDVAVYGKMGETCGEVTSLWFSGALPNGIQGNYKRVTEINQDDATSIVTVEEYPMVSLRDDPANTLRGNERFEGVSIDIFNEAVKLMAARGKKFRYKIYMVEDAMYGRKDEVTGQWNGLFGDLKERKARVAIGHISKTTSRMKEFSFTTSFGFVGLTYIMKRQPIDTDWFPFLRPFQPLVWTSLLFTMVMSGIFVHLLEFWNPFHQTLPESDQPSLLSMKESQWYAYLTMTAIGAPYAPTGHATRAYSIFYWFFALLVVACYTGNLASFLTESRYRKTPGSLTDLLRQDELSYGTSNGSSNADFFKNSPVIEFRQMYGKMKETGFVTNTKDGIALAKNSSYAFIGDNVLLNYYAGTDEECELVTLQSGAADLTEVAFAADPTWPLLDDFSSAIAELREDGKLRDIYQSWLKNAKKCKSEAEEDDNETAHLTFASFQGLYLLLGIFSIISIAVLCIKMIMLQNTRKKRQQSRKYTEDNGDNGQKALDADVINNEHAEYANITQF